MKCCQTTVPSAEARNKQIEHLHIVICRGNKVGCYLCRHGGKPLSDAEMLFPSIYIIVHAVLRRALVAQLW